MVAKITVPTSVRKALNYNEHKVKVGLAQCLYAHNFLKDAKDLNFFEKLERFESLIALNNRASTNTVHVSLNFAEGENLNAYRLTEIARMYMEKIGFEDQPYLVYQHHDSGHPHIHIVTTNIQNNGKRISLHNLGKGKSNEVRKEIEKAFRLVRAEEQKNKNTEKLPPVSVQKILYGSTPTKKAITNVLDAVLPRYKYSSLAELNAVLGLYNVAADKGKENSRIAKYGGLLYKIIDSRGNKIGIPIKASSIYNKPTLKHLEKRFKENDSLKEEYKKRIKSTLDWVLINNHKSLQSFQTSLAKEKITLVIRQNEEGIIYGLTYIDHKSQSVFNGSALGKLYSAKSILQRCNAQPLELDERKKQHIENPLVNSKQSEKQHSMKPELTKAIDELISPVQPSDPLPYQLKKQKKKRKSSKP